MFARYAKLNKDSLRDRALCKQECCFFASSTWKKICFVYYVCKWFFEIWESAKESEHGAWTIDFSSFSIISNKNISKALKAALKCFVCFDKIRTLRILFRKTMWGDSKQETANCAVFLLKLKWSAHKLWLLHYIKSPICLKKRKKYTQKGNLWREMYGKQMSTGIEKRTIRTKGIKRMRT